MSEIRPLTGLRGIAAFTVFLAHTRETLGDHGMHIDVPDWVARLFLSGGRQVDIFFMLSGFILAMNYRDWFAESIHLGPYLTFLRRRIARIYPLYFVMLLLVIAFVLAARWLGLHSNFGLDRFRMADLPPHFLLMHAWGIFSDDAGYWNPPSWSISIEAVAYLVFPLMAWLIARSRRWGPWPAIVLAIAIGVLLNARVHWGLAGFAGISRGVSEFFLGCTLMGLYGTATAAWLQSTAGSLCAAALIVGCYLLEPDTGFDIALCAAPLLLTLAKDNVVSRMFGWQPVFFLGEISYSIYLGHFLLSSISYRLVSESWMRTGPLQLSAGIIVIIAFVLAASTALYYGVERPGRRLLSGRKRES